MTSFSYGTSDAGSSSAGQSAFAAELRDKGFCVLPDVLSRENLDLARMKLDDVYGIQEAEVGRGNLLRIKDADIARLPLAYDPWFLDLACNAIVLTLVRELIGDFVVLHLQNGIINRPAQSHRQSVWHRDLPYQEWTSSKPLAVSALYCIDPFTPETGCTHVLPHSHQADRLPRPDYVNEHAVPVAAPAGSVICFDCMLFHRAGQNSSSEVRRGINHVYTIPLIKQQIDLPRALGRGYATDPRLAQLLGYTSQSYESVGAWRAARF
jgi:ectoine hydroxylase-related dioxygenase (phytanoyl-CoA dioxygenase family)